jgi:hypothetical protein
VKFHLRHGAGLERKMRAKKPQPRRPHAALGLLVRLIVERDAVGDVKTVILLGLSRLLLMRSAVRLPIEIRSYIPVRIASYRCSVTSPAHGEEMWIQGCS